MIKHQSVHTVLLACLLLAFSGSASADIVECVDVNGLVTFTDVPCLTNADAERGLAARDTAPAASKPVPQKQRFAAAEKARAVAWAKKRPANRALALDVATMSAARSEMALSDQASALARQQALAEKSLEQDSWKFWRS